MRPQRSNVNIRISAEGLAWLDGIAEKNNTNRSRVIRTALYIAGKHQAEIDDLLKPIGVEDW